VVAGEYQGVLAANVPGSATDISLEGAGPVVAAGPDGPTRVVAGGYFQLPRGKELDVTVKFRLPPGVTAIDVEPSARVPAIRWHVPDRTFEDFARERVEW
jgi:hypothetical protein